MCTFHFHRRNVRSYFRWHHPVYDGEALFTSATLKYASSALIKSNREEATLLLRQSKRELSLRPIISCSSHETF
jgi:hypothetical protein